MGASGEEVFGVEVHSGAPRQCWLVMERIGSSHRGPQGLKTENKPKLQTMQFKGGTIGESYDSKTLLMRLDMSSEAKGLRSTALVPSCPPLKSTLPLALCRVEVGRQHLVKYVRVRP